MSSYLKILKLLFKDMFKKREKRQVLMFVFLGIFYVSIAISAVSLVYLFSIPFKEAGKEVELVSFILFIDFVLTIVFGIIATISYLFLSKDVEFFKTLPVKSTSVFLAKITVVLLTEAAISAAILIPSLITAGISMQLPILFYFFIPVFIVCVPLFSIGLVGIISLPLMYIISLFKNKGMASSIAVIVAFAVSFILYMRFIMSIQYTVDEPQQSFDSLFTTATTLSNVIYPIYMLAKFSTLKTAFGLPPMASYIVELAIFFGCLALMLLLSFFLIRLIYNKTTAKILEGSGSKVNKQGKFVYSSPTKTLMKNEWRAIIRNPAVAMQVASGVILCPIIVVLFSVMFANMAQSFDAEVINVDISSLIWVACTMAIMMFGVGTNAGAVTCISREGRCINSLKTMPISAKTIISAKRSTYLLTQSLSILTGIITMVVVMIIYESFIWWVPIGAAAMTFVWLLAMTNLSIYLDLKNPRLDWKNFKEILKRGKNNFVAVVWILTCMIMGYILMGLIAAGLLLNAYYFMLFGYIILTGVGLTFALLLQHLLNNKGETLFSKLSI